MREFPDNFLNQRRASFVRDDFRIAGNSPKIFSFASRNSVPAPQRAHVRKTDWNNEYTALIPPQHSLSEREWKAFSSNREFFPTHRDAQNWGRKLIGYGRSHYNQELVFLARCL